MFKQVNLWQLLTVSIYKILWILFIISCVFSTNAQFCFQGFVAGTAVKVPYGYQPIECIKKGDTVISRVDQHYVERSVVEIVRSKVPYFYQVCIGDEVICAASNQKLYLSEIDEWIEMHALTDNQAVHTNRGSLYINRIVQVYEEGEVFDFIVAEDHNFCVTRHDVVAHNFVPVVFGLSWLIGAGAIEFAGVTIAAGVAGIGIGLALHNKDGKRKLKLKLGEQAEKITQGDGGGPEDP